MPDAGVIDAERQSWALSWGNFQGGPMWGGA